MIDLTPELEQLIAGETELFRAIRRQHYIQVTVGKVPMAVGFARDLAVHTDTQVRAWASTYITASPDRYIIGSQNHGAYRLTPPSER